MSPLTDTELTALAGAVDAQLAALQSAPETLAPLRGAAPDDPNRLPAAPEQQAVIEKATGEAFDTFWKKFHREARRDLCLPGGKLYEQWKKWSDLDSKTAVGQVHGILVGMGIAAHSLAPVAVAATVFLLNVLLNIGIKAICEGCEQE
jgi:hypothetical protein